MLLHDVNICVFWHGRGWQVALHIARGLHYMHSRKVRHLDLKSANILLARDGTAKIAVRTPQSHQYTDWLPQFS